MNPDDIKTLHDARLLDPTVQRALEANLSADRIIVELVKQKQQLLKELIQLESISPRKYRLGGQVFVWHCPDEFVPMRDLGK